MLAKNHRCLLHVMSAVNLSPLVSFVPQTIHHFYLLQLPVETKLELLSLNPENKTYDLLRTLLPTIKKLIITRCSFSSLVFTLTEVAAGYRAIACQFSLCRVKGRACSQEMWLTAGWRARPSTPGCGLFGTESVGTLSISVGSQDNPYFYLTVPQCTWDLSSPTADRTHASLQQKHGVFSTGLPGKPPLKNL